MSICIYFNNNNNNKGAWVAQSVKGPTLDFDSGHDLTVHGFWPHVGLCMSVDPA